MGHLTEFMKPGAFRIASTANTSVPNVAWINPDGSKALIAYNASGTTGAQKWTATAAHDLVSPASGRCLDATGPSSASGTRLQIWDCTGTSKQKWTVPGN